jgi:hypothetical protein
MEQQLFSVKEAGVIIGYGKTKTHQLINRGLLEAVLVDGITRITADAIEDFLRNLEPANKRRLTQAGPRTTGEQDQGAEHAQKQPDSLKSAQARRARRR